ncbi:MAG: FtsX-like permease family protein [Chloracidobacterium sp.]
MLFSLRMLWREMRSMWRQMLFFLLCIAVGTGLIMTLRSAIQNIRAALVKQTRSFLAADLEVRLPYGRVAALRPRLDEILMAFPDVGRTDVIELATGVVADNEEALRVLVRAVDEHYPLDGQIALEGDTYRYELLANRGIVVSASLLERLDTGLGKPLKIGNQSFTIRGVFKREGSSAALGEATPVLMTSADLKTTGLLTAEGRGTYFIRLRVGDRPDRVEAVAQTLRQSLPVNSGASVETARAREGRVVDRLDEAENFFSLVGLAVTMLGGVGIASVTYTIIGQRVRAIAVLKCLGASDALVFRVYALQMGLLGLLGSALGWALAELSGRVFGPDVATRFPFPVAFVLTWSAIGQGFGVGLIVALAFSVVPLVGIRNVKPSLLLRSRHEALRLPLRWVIPTGLAAVAMLYALFIWQAGSFSLGNTMFQAMVVTLLALYGVSWVVIRLAGAARQVSGFTLRYGLAALRRPGNQAAVIVMTVGFGLFFALTVRLLERNLLDSVNLAASENLPNLLLFNVLPSQTDSVSALVERQVQAKTTFIPIISARLTAINGQRIDFAAIKEASRRAAVDREFRLTYRSELDAGEQIVEGTWWLATPAEPLELSLETFLQKNLGARVGDRLTLDIQGREVSGVIRSIRRIDPRRGQQFFAIVARPGGVLSQAPQTFLGAVKTDAFDRSPDAYRKLTLALVKGYPNISVALTSDFLKTVRAILDGLQAALTMIGTLVVLSGVAMLVGAVALTRYQRQYETALLKTLGARFVTLFGMTIVEYGALGAAAAAIGGGGALGASWYVTCTVLRTAWQPFWGDWLIGIAGTLVLVIVVGSVASWDILRKKPLGVLRGGD